jgi:hypothetical protein
MRCGRLRIRRSLGFRNREEPLSDRDRIPNYHFEYAYRRLTWADLRVGSEPSQ